MCAEHGATLLAIARGAVAASAHRAPFRADSGALCPRDSTERPDPNAECPLETTYPLCAGERLVPETGWDLGS